MADWGISLPTNIKGCVSTQTDKILTELPFTKAADQSMIYNISYIVQASNLGIPRKKELCFCCDFKTILKIQTWEISSLSICPSAG